MILWLRFRCGEIDGNLRWRVESCYMTNVILRHASLVCIKQIVLNCLLSEQVFFPSGITAVCTVGNVSLIKENDSPFGINVLQFTSQSSIRREGTMVAGHAL